MRTWKLRRSAWLSCLTMKRSSRVLAKKLLLLPPRGSHLQPALLSAPISSFCSLCQTWRAHVPRNLCLDTLRSQNSNLLSCSFGSASINKRFAAPLTRHDLL